MSSRVEELIRQRESVQAQLSQRTKDRKGLAREAKRAWKKCRELEKELNQAFTNMQSVAERQEQLFRQYVIVKTQNDSQASATRDSDTKNRLIEGISVAEAEWRDFRENEFIPARDKFRSLHQQYQSMKAGHAKLSEELNTIRADIDDLIVRRADLSRLVNLEQFLDNPKGVREREQLAECLGLSSYSDSVKVKVSLPSGYNIYYGQKATPSDHGHIVVGPTGKIIYSRLPGSPKGRSNFKGPTARKGRYQKPVARLMSCTSALSLAVGQV